MAQVRLRRLVIGSVIVLTTVLLSSTVNAQTTNKTSWTAHWNWAVYAKDKSELPPAYQDVEDIREIPSYALDLTIKQRGNLLRGTFGLVARYLARVDEGDIAATIKGNQATMRLKSNFGGAATILITLRGGKLHWKVVSSSGENFFPLNAVLRRVPRGERLPYVADESETTPE